MKYKVDRVFENATDFNGNPYYNKFTKQPEPEFKFVINGETLFTNGTFAQKSAVKEGDEVEGEILEKVSKSGKPYKVFAFAKPKDPEFEKIWEAIVALQNDVSELKSAKVDEALPPWDQE